MTVSRAKRTDLIVEVFKDAFEKSGAPTEALRYGDRKVCTDYALSMVDFARRYEKVLSAQK